MSQAIPQLTLEQVTEQSKQIADNIDLIIKRIAVKLEKGTMNIRSAYIKTTMGPAERLI